MRALVDTNVWLDIIANREPFSFDSKGAVMICINEYIDISVVGTSLKDIFFLMDKAYGHAQAYEAVESILDIADVASVDGLVCKDALELERPDYEDGIIAAAALADKVDWIITRDTNAFKELGIPKLTPKGFIEAQGYDEILI